MESNKEKNEFTAENESGKENKQYQQQSKTATKINLNLDHLTKEVILTDSTNGFVTQINLPADQESTIKFIPNQNEILKPNTQTSNSESVVLGESFDEKKLKNDQVYTI